MLRLIPAIVITGASILIGCSLSLRLSRRCAVLRAYIALLDGAADKMQYTDENLAEVFSGNFAGVIFDPALPFADQWERMAETYRDILDSEDKKVLLSFGAELGSGDTAAEINRIRLCQSLLKERLDAARENCEKKSKLYRILPFSIGLAVTILIL